MPYDGYDEVGTLVPDGWLVTFDTVPRPFPS